MLKKPDSENENTQTPSKENVTVSQGIRDRLTRIKDSKKNKVYWNGVLIDPIEIKELKS